MVVFYNMTENEVKNYNDFHLSIEVSSEKISFLLIDKATAKPIALENFSLSGALSETLNKSEILKKSSPSSVSCSVVNSLFTLMPSSIFSEEKIDTYLSFCTPKSENEVMALADNHQKRKIVSCYFLDKNIRESILQVFPYASFKHTTTILCDSLPDGFHINFSEESSYEIISIVNNQLVFCNRFHFENHEESLYYITLVAEKLKIAIKETKISLSGIVNKNGDMLSFWKQFIPKENITFNEIETSQLNAVSRHQYFTLHKQFSCVS